MPMPLPGSYLRFYFLVLIIFQAVKALASRFLFQGSDINAVSDILSLGISMSRTLFDGFKRSNNILIARFLTMFDHKKTQQRDLFCQKKFERASSSLSC